MGDGKDCAPVVLLDRQMSSNVVVFLIPVCVSKLFDILFPKDDEILVGLSF